MRARVGDAIFMSGEAGERRFERRFPIPLDTRVRVYRWAYVNVDVGDGGAFAYDSRVR